jgi:hypothetical protein
MKNYCSVTKTTVQTQLSYKEEFVYSISNDKGRFYMPSDEIARLLSELLGSEFITHFECTAGGPLIIKHSAWDIEGRDFVANIFGRYCNNVSFLPGQVSDLNLSRTLPQVHEPKPLEDW